MRVVSFLLIITLFIEASTTRIMPLGDSITYDDAYRDYPNARPASMRSAYRNSLWYLLDDGNYNVNFVGSRSAGSAITPSFDPHNEGYPGWTSGQIANIIYSKLIANPADIILLHIGSNDWDDSIDGINSILNEIDRYEENYDYPIKVILARIINRETNYAWISNLNRNIQSLANSRIRAGDDIVIVDMEYGAKINYKTEFQDPTHPNNTAYAKMANVWFEALERILTPVPTVPSKFSSSTIESDSVVLSWSDTSNNETGFKIYQDGTLIATLPKNTTTYTVTNLKRVTKYTYTIKAYNDEGTSDSKTITVTTKDDYAWLSAIITILND
jgi:lysophospholipase L1-like esterase